jgi:integrase
MRIVTTPKKQPKLATIHPPGSTTVAPDGSTGSEPITSAGQLLPFVAPHPTRKRDATRNTRPDNRVAFTMARIEALPIPTSDRAYYFDCSATAPRGFGVTVYSSGRKSFMLYRKVDGKPGRILIGPFPDLSLDEARKMAEEKNGLIAKGGNPQKEKSAVRAEMTLQEMFEKYEKAHGSKLRTWKEMTRLYTLHLRPVHYTKIGLIKRVDLVHINRRIAAKHGIYTANRVMEVLKGMYTWAITEEDWTGQNPVAYVKAFKETKRARIVSRDEAPRFQSALEAENNPDMRDYFELALQTGGRRSNVAAMRWAQIDWAEKRWTIPGDEFKNGEETTIPLLSEAMAILRRRYKTAATQWVFPSTLSASGHLINPTRAWRRILKSAGLKDSGLRIHDLRRSAGSYQAMSPGSSLPVIGASLGQKDSKSTEVYTRVDVSAARASMMKGRATWKKAAAKKRVRKTDK